MAANNAPAVPGFSIESFSGQPQHDLRAWIGGHFTEPNEQKTQQSPGFGRSKVLQASHSWKNWQASAGMVSRFTWPQCGHVKSDSRTRSLMEMNAVVRRDRQRGRVPDHSCADD